ncbi:MAG: DUF1353 domain-containing protein [Actinomycetota bacterium]
MPFVGDADVEVKQLDAKNWELLAPLRYEGKFEPFDIPAGMRTDFASVPRPFVWLIPRYGTYTKAAILHDYLWRQHAKTGKMTWADADGIFRRAMRELGVAFLRRWITWSAVRMASLFTKRGGRTGWTDDILQAIVFWLFGILIVGPPGVLILIALALFYLLEYAVWLVLSGARALRRAPPPKNINQPKLRLTL